MSEVRKIDKSYAKFLQNLKYQKSFDLSIIPKGKKGGSKKGVNQSIEEKVRSSVDNQPEEENNYSPNNQSESEEGQSEKWVNLSFEEKIRYSVESQFKERKETPSFNLPKESAEELISNNMLSRLGYEIVDKDDTKYGVNFRVKRAS